MADEPKYLMVSVLLEFDRDEDAAVDPVVFHDAAVSFADGFGASVVTITRPASRERDGLPEGWRERLAEFAEWLERDATPSEAFHRAFRRHDTPERRLDAAADVRAALSAASQGGGGLAEGEACFLCGKPEGLPVSATGKHDACAAAYDTGRQDEAAEGASLRSAWDALLEGLRAKGLNSFDRYEDEGPTEAEIVAYVLTNVAAAGPGRGLDREAVVLHLPVDTTEAARAALRAVGHSSMCDTLADEPCDCPYPALATRAVDAAITELLDPRTGGEQGGD